MSLPTHSVVERVWESNKCPQLPQPQTQLTRASAGLYSFRLSPHGQRQGPELIYSVPQY